MNRLKGFLAGLVATVGLMSGPAHAAGLPVVISTTVDSAHNMLTINGQNFGNNPVITLGSLRFTTAAGWSSTRIVGNFPTSNPASSFTPGTYFMTVQFSNQLPSIYTVDIGAQGAAGPQGPIGPQGAKGDPGPAGPKGADGAIGPAGQNGTAGAQGPKGDTGPQGLQGLQGPKGDKGDPGSGGGGLVCTTAPNVYLATAANGTQTCQPRYADNGDGTVSDNQTGLMWEKQTSTCAGEVTCINNFYSWSSTGTLADGTLFTNFLAGLNGGDYYSPSAGQIVSASPTTCFVNHCDWRIPTLAELETIIESTAADCGSGSNCIDPAFGLTLTLADDFWSSSSGNADFAWGVYFGEGNAFSNFKTARYYARAVRSSR
jgi:Protein of unknown function (DUF1566)/Collagen triple helix repeat (20 copies)